MFSKKSNSKHSPVVHYVPGYTFYDDVGTSLAEKLVDLIEFFVATLMPFRR